jgi:hypothetical protein
VALQRLVDEFGLMIMVSHYPPGGEQVEYDLYRPGLIGH